MMDERPWCARCAVCGGSVQLLALAGRTRELRHGIDLPIPEDFEIPTCSQCGEEYMTPEISGPLDQLLEELLARSGVSS